jgi:hypothetical protein
MGPVGSKISLRRRRSHQRDRRLCGASFATRSAIVIHAATRRSTSLVAAAVEALDGAHAGRVLAAIALPTLHATAVTSTQVQQVAGDEGFKAPPHGLRAHQGL